MSASASGQLLSGGAAAMPRGEEVDDSDSEESSVREDPCCSLSDLPLQPLRSRSRPRAHSGPDPTFQTLDISMRFRSPMLLLWGGVFGMMGFVLAFAIGLVDFFMRRENIEGEPYPSGHGYWPSTVSEMVYSWNSPQGRIFYGCCLCSAFFIFTSWYPYELRNAFTGPERLYVCGFSAYWITFRQMVPVAGLLLLICVSTVPFYVAEFTDYFAIAVHLFGAFMMFAGYIVAELKCLAICGFRSHSQGKYLDIEPSERRTRVALMVVVVVNYGIFCGLQGLLVWGYNDTKICCHDQYVNSQTRNGTKLNFNQRLAMQDTASGVYMYLKILSFMSEVVAGMALIASHLVVWYYCEERHVDFGVDALIEVYDEERGVDTLHSTDSDQENL